MKRWPQVAISVTAAWLSFQAGLNWPQAQAKISEQISVVLQAADIISSRPLTRVSKPELMQAASKGLVKALQDPYSDFILPADFKAMNAEKNAQYIGLGVELAYREQAVLVMSVIEQSPAAEAGMVSGDQILSIEQQDVKNLSWSEILKNLSGESGSFVTILVKKPQQKPRSLRLQSRVLPIQNLELLKLDDSICHVKVRSFFQENLHLELAEQLAQAENACAHGLILDLRNNPGGLVQEAVAMAGQLGLSGTILQMSGREEHSEYLQSTESALLPNDVPIVVLINQGTASASEIVAAALQENGRAILIGETSFGKGLVQSLLPLDDGSGLSLSTHQYLTSRGQNLHQVGLEPDIPLLDESDPGSWVDYARDYLKDIKLD